MKTDRFADSIRRKLDSIRPEFSERDWTKMQAMLKQAGPLPGAAPVRPRVFSGQAARLIAAGAAGTVLFLGTTLYQTYEVNRLRKSAQATSQSTTVSPDSDRVITNDTPVADRTAIPSGLPEPSAGSQSSPTIIRDTVYIDRYIHVPAASTERVAHTPDPTPGKSTGMGHEREPVVSERLNNAGQRSAVPGQPVDGVRATEPVAGVRPENTGTSPANQAAGLRPQLTTGQRHYSNGAPMTDQTGTVGTDRIGNRTESVAGGRRTTSREAGRRTNNATGSDMIGNGTNSFGTSSSSGSVELTGQSTDTQTEPVATGDFRPAGNEATGSAAISVEPIVIQPVQLGAVAWEQRLMQRSRRMRPARTVVVGGPAVAKANETKLAPEKPDRQSVPSPVKLRVGVGSDLNGKLWSVGGFAEVLAGRHLTFSVGLSHASFANGSYISEGQFNQQYHQGPQGSNFRREFGLEKRIDPRHDIINIDLQTIRLVMPLTIGYRLPINSSFAITPTLGTILNLQSQEQVSYIVRRPPSMPPYGYSSEYSSDTDCQYRKVSILSNVMLGTTVEWQKKHWGLQAGPILTISSQPDPDWVSSLSGGVRARASFQF